LSLKKCGNHTLPCTHLHYIGKAKL
jgi:hypothetical protein